MLYMVIRVHTSKRLKFTPPPSPMNLYPLQPKVSDLPMSYTVFEQGYNQPGPSLSYQVARLLLPIIFVTNIIFMTKIV